MTDEWREHGGQEGRHRHGPKKIVEPEMTRADPDRTVVPYFKPSPSCIVRMGAHPSACRGYYGSISGSASIRASMKETRNFSRSSWTNGI